MLSRLPEGTRDQPSSSPTSCSYSALDAQEMNSHAASFFSLVSGTAKDQAHSQPDVSVSLTGAKA